MFNKGAYPTMITPYNKDGSIDRGALSALTEWYYNEGCDGIFASCQSSEIHELSLSERVGLAGVVKETADRLAKNGRRMTIVASGHVSDRFEDQVKELNEVAATGVDSLILISNRLDIENTSDGMWIKDLDRLVGRLPDIPLGIYECPRPYKRLLTPAMIEHMTKSGRFAFIKDTCCDPDEIDRRIKLIESTPSGGLKPMLFNANAQTLGESLKSGGAGYCGVMCNFHPALYVRFCREPENEILGAFLSQAAFIESVNYPTSAKYHLDKIGVRMESFSRVGHQGLTRYERLCVDKMDLLAKRFEKESG